MAHRSFTTHPIVLRSLRVARVSDITPRMRRITLTGEQLDAFERNGLSLASFASTGFDDHVKLVFASDGDIAAALPVQLAQTIDWPNAANREMRDYTPRRFDPVAGELDIDFVRHGHGPAASWAEQAVVGDELHIAGPKSSLLLPENIDGVILAGDETALPAIGRYLDERPSRAPVHVVVELRHPDATQDLALRAGDTVRWVEARPEEPSAMVEAVQRLPWPSGEVYVWAAAESGSLLPLRRWLSRERGVPKSHINVTGYWHAATDDGSSAATPAQAGPARAVDPAVLLSPVPWLAARAALQSGLLDAVADRPRPARDLAATCELDEPATRTLVDYLVEIDVFARLTDAEGGGTEAIRLGPVGEAMLGDEHMLASLEDTLESRALVAMTELAPALRGGASAFARRHGRTLLDELDADSGRFEERLGDALGFGFVVRGILELDALNEADSVAVTGVGSLAVADALGAERLLTIVESAVPRAVLREAAGTTAAAFSGEWPTSDLAVSALALAYRSDEEAVALLLALAAGSRRAIVIEQLEGEGLGPPDLAEHRLVDLAASGIAVRAAADIARLAEAAGWTLSGQSTLGWNYEAFELLR